MSKAGLYVLRRVLIAMGVLCKGVTGVTSVSCGVSCVSSVFFGGNCSSTLILVV